MLWQNVLNSFYVGEYRGAFQQAPLAYIVNYTVQCVWKLGVGHDLRTKNGMFVEAQLVFGLPLYSWSLFPACISLHSFIPPSAYFLCTSTFPGFSVQHILASLNGTFSLNVSFCFHLYLRCYVGVCFVFVFFPRYVFWLVGCIFLGFILFCFV